MIGDFTNGDNFAHYLSSYWSQMFSDREFIKGVTEGFSRQLAQHYQDFAETVNASSVRSIPPFHTELVYPIFIRRSTYSTGPRVLTFGAGAVFGPQPANATFREGVTMHYGQPAQRSPTFYAGLPDDVKGSGALILNRLYNPSVVLVAGADFFFDNGIVVFREDIFVNPLIAKRAVPAPDGSVDQEIVLWATNVQLEQFQLYRQYGHLFLGRNMSGPDAKTALVSIFKLLSGGPSIAHLDSFVAAAANFPVTAEAVEKVVSIDRLGDTTVVVTDTGVYRVSAGLSLRSSIVPGAVLSGGSPLTTATVVNDRFSDPLWWTRLDALTIGRGLTVQVSGNIGFVNQDVPVTFDTPAIVDETERALCRFYVAGLPKDVDSFWTETRNRSLESQSFLAETLWTGAGLVDGDGNPDYTQDLTVNPLRLLNDLIGDNLIIVQVNGTLSGPLLPILGLLRETIPAYCTLVVLLNLNVEDDYLLTSDSVDAVNPAALPFVDPRALYTGNTAGFDSTTQGYWEDTDTSTSEPLTKTAEALSAGLSPDMLLDTINLESGPASVSESVIGRLELVC